MWFLGTSGRDLRLGRRWCRLLRFRWSRRGLFGPGRPTFSDRKQRIVHFFEKACGRWTFAAMSSRHLFHCTAATAAQVLSHGRTYERFSSYFDFAATLGINTPITFIASHATLVS